MSTSRGYWFSSLPLPFPGTSRPPQQDNSSDATSAVSSMPTMLPSTEKEEIWSEEVLDSGEERRKLPGLRLHPLFDRPAPDDSPLSSPMSDTLSDDDDSTSLSPLQHPHPTPPATPAGVPLCFGPEESRPVLDQEFSTGKGGDNVVSRSPSLVPTIIDSRPPSPDIHPCIAEAEALGIKVRDFAYEEHGVPVARPVPDIETLKARYQLYRSGNQTPPNEVVDTLRDYDPFWLMEKKQFYDDRHRADDSNHADSGVSKCHAKAKFWCGSQSESSGESCAVEESFVDISADSTLLSVKRDRAFSGEDIN